MKKGYIRGVITCDPSWRGLAFTIHVPSFEYNDSLVMDLGVLLDNKKKLTQPSTYIPLVVIAVNELIKKRPIIRICDKLIMESQFKENMKALSNVITSVILTRLPHMSVEKLSALTCKRQYSVEYGEGHYSNKLKMLEYVKSNKDKLIAGDTVKDHNTADSIIILNTWLSLKRRHLYQDVEEFMEKEEHWFDVPYELKGAWFRCPCCGFDTARMGIVKNPPKEQGRPDLRGTFFMACKNRENPTIRCSAPLSFIGKNPPKLVNGKFGNATIGVWEKTDGTKKPENFNAFSNAQYPGAYNTVPVEPLSGVKRQRENSPEPENNIINDLVESLQNKQEKLEERITEMQKKTEDTLAKLLSAISGSKPNPEPETAPPPKKKRKTGKETAKEHYVSKIKFSADELEEMP